MEEITSGGHGQGVNKSMTNDSIANVTNSANGNNGSSANSNNNASLVQTNCNDSSTSNTLNCPSSTSASASLSSSSSSSTATTKANVPSVNLNGATVIRVNPYVNNKTCVTLTCHGSPIIRQQQQQQQIGQSVDQRMTLNNCSVNQRVVDVSNEVTQFTKLKNLLPFLLSQPSESISLETFFQLLPFGTSAVNNYVYKFNSYGIYNLQQLLTQVTGEKVNGVFSNPNVSLVSICIGNEGHRKLLYNALDFFGGIQQENKQCNNVNAVVAGPVNGEVVMVPPPLPKKSLTMGDLSSQIEPQLRSNDAAAASASSSSNLFAPTSCNGHVGNKINGQLTHCCSNLNSSSSKFYCNSDAYSITDADRGGQDVSMTCIPMDIEMNESNCPSIESSGHFEQHNNNNNSSNNNNNGNNRFISIRNRKLNLPSSGQNRHSAGQNTAKSAPSTPAGEVSSDDLTAWFRRFSFFGPG